MRPGGRPTRQFSNEPLTGRTIVKTTMHARDRVHWICLAILSISYGLAMVAFEVSRTANVVNLILTPGATVSFQTHRILSAPLNVELRFNEHGSLNKRPELGGSTYNGDFRERGYLEFKQPGEPVIVRVTSNRGMDAKFEALPRSSSSGIYVTRALVLKDNDDSPQQFPWPPRSIQLPAGVSDLTISVVDAGPSLVGETVTLVVEPPVGFKSVASGYGWLWPLFLWPFFIAFLVIYFAVLCRRRQS